MAVVTVEEVRDGRMNRHLVVVDADDWQRIEAVYAALMGELVGRTIEAED
jgi:hypothetical protein